MTSMLCAGARLAKCIVALHWSKSYAGYTGAGYTGSDPRFDKVFGTFEIRLLPKDN